jgi:hypothetical protein
MGNSCCCCCCCCSDNDYITLEAGNRMNLIKKMMNIYKYIRSIEKDFLEDHAIYKAVIVWVHIQKELISDLKHFL